MKAGFGSAVGGAGFGSAVGGAVFGMIIVVAASAVAYLVVRH